MQNLSQDSPLDLLSSGSDKQHSSAMFRHFNEVLYDLSMTSTQPDTTIPKEAVVA
jgi:hypothetical protein